MTHQQRRIRSIAVGLTVALGLCSSLMTVAKATTTWPPSECPTSPDFPRWTIDPDVCTTVKSQQPSGVTLSTAVQPTFATFRVTATHYTVRTELLSPVVVRLSTSVLDALGAPVSGQSAPILSGSQVSVVGTGVSVTCAPPSPALPAAEQAITLDCTISQLNSKGPPPDSATFDIRVLAPAGGAQLRLTANTKFGEYHPIVWEYEPPRFGTVALLAPNPNLAASFVPPAGSLATVPSSCNAQIPGVIGCAATPTDPWTTTIVVRQGANFAQITQAKDAPGCARAGNVLDCRTSDISVPSYDNGLVIFLRRDGSTINGGNIKHAIVYYTATTPTPGIVYPLRVPVCTDTTYGTLPRSGVPCLNSEAAPGRPYVTTEYKKKTTPKDGPPTPKQVVPPGFERDWEFVIYAVDNGRYEQ